LNFEKNILHPLPGIIARRLILRCNSCLEWLQPLWLAVCDDSSSSRSQLQKVGTLKMAMTTSTTQAARRLSTVQPDVTITLTIVVRIV
jgi:hypothetical protein